MTSFHYGYSEDFQALSNQREEILNWSYDFDSDGNVINVDFGPGQSDFEVEFGSRVSKVTGKKNLVDYDPSRGIMTAR